MFKKLIACALIITATTFTANKFDNITSLVIPEDYPLEHYNCEKIEYAVYDIHDSHKARNYVLVEANNARVGDDVLLLPVKKQDLEEYVKQPWAYVPNEQDFEYYIKDLCILKLEAAYKHYVAKKSAEADATKNN